MGKTWCRDRTLDMHPGHGPWTCTQLWVHGGGELRWDIMCVSIGVFVCMRMCVCGGVDFIACVLWTCTVGNAGEDSGVVLGSSPPPMMYLGGHKLPPGEPSTHHFQKAILWLPRSLLPQTTVRIQPLPLKTPRLCPPPSCLALSADFSLISHHHSDATSTDTGSDQGEDFSWSGRNL